MRTLPICRTLGWGNGPQAATIAVCLGLSILNSGCGGGGGGSTPPPDNNLTITGNAVDLNTGNPVAVRVTAPGLSGSPFTFCTGAINIPNVPPPSAGISLTLTVQGLSSSLTYESSAATVTTAASANLGTVQLPGAPLPPATAPANPPAGCS